MKDTEKKIVNRDENGKMIPAAFPISDRTKKDQSKTSVLYTVLAIVLYVLSFVPMIATTAVLGVRTYKLVPYYSFWPFIGVIVVGLFAIIFMAIVFIVSRKKTKSSISTQTVKIAITYTCLTAVFALILTYFLPDIIGMATQNTLYAEELYYNGEHQAEINAQIDRNFIMYNLMNGNLNDYTVSDGDFSYNTLKKHDNGTSPDLVLKYDNPEIEAKYEEYIASYETKEALQEKVIDVMKAKNPRKYELYEFVYKYYVLNDYNYCIVNSVERRAFTLSVVDYVYEKADYAKLIKQGLAPDKNNKVYQLFKNNFDNFNLDGYQPFDDTLLLLAQQSTRMGIPVVLQLILNDTWQQTQYVIDPDTDQKYYFDQGNYLYELYDADTRDKFEAAGGSYDYVDDKFLNMDGTTMTVRYGYNEDGWMVYENGVVKRPMNWIVLDMLGDPMDIATVEINSAIVGLLSGIDLPDEINIDFAALEEQGLIGDTIANLLKGLGGLINGVGGLVQDDVSKLVAHVANNGKLTIGICINDDGALALSLIPAAASYGMLGYMQASWMESNGLLMAVINLVGVRNWLCIFSAIGLVLVIAAGILRECGYRTRLRTEVARDRIIRYKTMEGIENGEPIPDEVPESSEETPVEPEDAPVADTVPEEPAGDEVPTETSESGEAPVEPAEEAPVEG